MKAWQEKLSDLSPQQQLAMDFLRTHLPAGDLDGYPPKLFLSFADHALFLRETVPWCKALDEEIFFHYVLFPRVNDEDLSFHRQIFYDALWPRVRDLSTVLEVIQEVNRWCHENVSYEAQDERTASPLTVYRCGSGRCGEESAFLVSALRSVGVPARQVYVPRWSHCDDNHAWVEALCGDRWRFLGACEPEPVLDRGWFNAPASRAVLVHSRLFGEGSSPLHGQSLGKDGIVTYYNQTSRYAPVWSRVFRARVDGKPAPGAVFRLQILNEASFHTIATLTGDENGEARVELGLGTVHVQATLGGLWAEGNSESGEMTLDLAPVADGDTDWIDFDFCTASAAPVNDSPLSAGERALRAETRQRGDALRTKRLASFYQPDPAHPQWDDLLRAARGNCGEILAFLRGGDAPDRERLLRTLAPKDLRDTDQATLEDHLARLAPRGSGIPEEIYWKYVACPRIGLEKLTAWRSGQWDGMDKRRRLVVSRRDAGVPARLRALDGAPEYWENGAFRTIFPDPTALLRLTGSHAPAQRRDWSLSRRTGDGWKLLDLSEMTWEGDWLTALLPAGQYRLVTATRLPGGDQLAAKRDFALSPGEERTISLRLRGYALEDALFCEPMPPASAVSRSGAAVSDIFRPDGRPTLLLWLEEGAEPTEHLLNELSDCRQAFEVLPLNVAFLLRGRESLGQSTLADLLLRWNSVHVWFDDWAFDLEDVARRLTRDPDAPPLAVLCDGRGRAVYAESGYRVGMGSLLLRAARETALRP